ncbi:MAG TPA: O-antigen translocase, partial [Acidobacteriaceae bacterium]|nr:O-antigen translocase [Acidobacteriaceae bacterium]
NILIGLVRTKVLAILLGPAGVGLVGLYRGLVDTGSTVANMGLNIVGTRQIAEADAREDDRALAVARRAIFWAAIVLACTGGLVMWSFRRLLAERVLGNATHAGIVGWLSLGVAFAVGAASQGALIQGMRRIGDIARVTVYGAIANTVVGIALIWRWGYAGLVFYVLVMPVASFLLGWLYVSRLPKVADHDISLPEMTEQWKMLLRLGIPFMGAALATPLILLWIRIDVSNVLGTEALGQFQASWTISTQYIALVLGAMAADYYPRLTGVMQDHAAATRLVNEQTEIALLLSAPIFLAMMGLAPWVLRVLYTADFAPAVVILRWQVLSDVLKVAAWPLGFVILAAGDGRNFFLSETSSLLIMGVLIAGLLRTFGLEMTGIAYLACYIFLLPLVYWLAKSRIGFAWSRSVVRLLAVAFVVCAGVGLVASTTQWGALVGCVASVAFGIHAVGRLSHMSDLGGSAGRIGDMARRLTAGFGK